MFEDERRVVMRLEVPGMDKDEFDIELLDDALVGSGQKRFERERTQVATGRPNAAYGSVRRVPPLAVPVPTDDQGQLQRRRAEDRVDQGQAVETQRTDDQGQVRQDRAQRRS